MLPFKSLISAQQLNPQILTDIFKVADDMKKMVAEKGRCDLLADKIIALIFLEPSSRTMLSFQSAAQRLSAGIIFTQGKENTSITKGESIEDTMRMVSGYADLIAARLPDAGAAEAAANASSVPFINGGDGGNQHPTQALIDSYTIHQEIGRLDNLHVAFGFDPKHSRSIHSLVETLSHYDGMRFTFIAPDSLYMPDYIRTMLENKNIQFTETDDCLAMQDADVIYLNRLQAERFKSAQIFDDYRHRYCLKQNMLTDKNKLILDPLPRVDEIAAEIDALPIAAYFRQAHNGIPIRMALLAMMLGRA